MLLLTGAENSSYATEDIVIARCMQDHHVILCRELIRDFAERGQPRSGLQVVFRWIRSVFTHVARSVVCVHVCLLGVAVSSAKADEWIEISLRRTCIDGNARWHHLANTIKHSGYGLMSHTLTAC